MENFKTNLDADGVLHIEFNVQRKTVNTENVSDIVLCSDNGLVV